MLRARPSLSRKIPFLSKLSISISTFFVFSQVALIDEERLVSVDSEVLVSLDVMVFVLIDELIVVALVCEFVLAFFVEDAKAKLVWDTCLLKINPKCALDIIGVVFKIGTINDACCHDLVQERKVCHDTLIKYIADRPLLISHETQYLKKNANLWAHCVSISQTA
ncbi:hypothetical protein N665_0135s0002 [Sinapis alba]|nr:hypothetical protein N665_0135s0002 [Sinapis alba]